MTHQLSRRSRKYVWLSLPAVLSLGLSAVWVVSIAPEAQQHTREETQWRRDIAAQKQRQEYLRENALETETERYKLSGFVLGKSDPLTIPEMYFPGGLDVFREDQTVKLLDEFGGCIGFIQSRKLYIGDDNPGLCGQQSPSEAKEQLEKSTHI